VDAVRAGAAFAALVEGEWKAIHTLLFSVEKRKGYLPSVSMINNYYGGRGRHEKDAGGPRRRGRKKKRRKKKRQAAVVVVHRCGGLKLGSQPAGGC